MNPLAAVRLMLISQLVIPQVLSDGNMVWRLYHTLRELKKNLHILTEEIVLPFMYAGTFGAVVLKLGAAAQSVASVVSQGCRKFL
jgi:hypothetical protein